jgi:hypothetical protein
LENVFERLEMAELYQLKSLHSSCGQLIRRNLNGEDGCQMASIEEEGTQFIIHHTRCLLM